MEKEFQQDTDTYVSERHSSILVKFKKENDKNFALSQSIAKQKENIKKLLSDNLWKEVNNVFDLIMLQGNIESKYLYIQGFRDCIDLAHFVEGEILNTDFEEIILPQQEREDNSCKQKKEQ